MRKALHHLALVVVAMSVIVRGVQQAALTTGGPTQDYAVSGAFGGANPKALLAFMSGGLTNGTQEDHARFSIGASDGTTSRCIAARARHAQTSSSAVRMGRTDAVGWMFSNTATSSQGAVSLSGFGADKATLSWDTLATSAFLTNVILLGGSDLSVKVGEFTGSTSDNGTTTVTPGFQAQAIILFSRGASTFDNTSANTYTIQLGLITLESGTIKQGCLTFIVENNVGAGTAKRSSVEIDSDRCLRQLVVGSPNTQGLGLECTAIGSTTFDITTRGGTTGLTCGYLALNFGGALSGYGLYTRDSLTSNTTDDFNAPGYPAQAIIGLHSLASSYGAIQTGADGGSMGVGFLTASEEFSVANMNDNSVTTTDVGSLTHNVACEVPTRSGADAIKFNRNAIDGQGANLDYTKTQGTAKKQLFLVIGRNNIYGRAMVSTGSAERAVAKSAHGGVAKTQAGAQPKAAAKVSHGGRAKDQAGAESKAAGTSSKGARGRAAAGAETRGVAGVAHGGRARATPGDESKAAGKVAHGAQAKAQAGVEDRAAPKVSHGARAAEQVGAIDKAAPTKPAQALAATGRTVAGAVAKASSSVSHGARATAQAGVASKGAATVAHGGRARAASGAQDRAKATVQHGGLARTTAGDASKSSAKVTHGARGAASAGAEPKAAGKASHGGRAQAAPGSADKAAPMKPAAGLAATGRTVAGAVGKAAAKVSHACRARAQSGEESKAGPKVTHTARASSAPGELDRGAPKKVASARAREQAGDTFSASARKPAGARASSAQEQVGRAPGKATHAGRALGDPQSGTVEQAKPKVTHGARARAVGGQVGTALLSPPEIIGFYERTSRAVRGRFKSVAGTLAVQYANLPFVEPQGVPWARVKVDFDEVQEVQFGSGRSTYRAPGVLLVELRAPIQEGTQALADLADSFAAQLQIQAASGVIYDAASIRQLGRDGDEYKVALRVPFRAEDSGFVRQSGTSTVADDWQGAESAVRARFRAMLPDVAVSYDNLPATTGATWVRLSVFETEAFNVDGMRRTVGVMQADVHTPLLEGERASLKLADRIVEAFRLVDAGGVIFSVPYLQGARQVLKDWVLPVYCPWTVDHA